LFTTFPGGWPGLGLLLLRVAVAAMAAIQGAGYLFSGGDHGFVWSIVGLSGVILSVSLAAGFLTPIASGLLGVGTACILLTQLPSPGFSVFDTKPPVILVLVINTAIIFVGPGAFSLDSRLFGRREIIIPPSSSLSKH